MTAEEMKKRTFEYARRVVHVVEALPGTRSGRILGDQLLRAGCSVGANYRAACRARSKADFIANLKIVEEECDESLYWMDLIQNSDLMKAERLLPLQEEGDAILSIVVASIRTARRSSDNRQS